MCRRALPPHRAVKGGRITDLGLENAFVEPRGEGPASGAEPLRAETRSLERAVTQGAARLDALEPRLGIYDCERPNSLVHFKGYLK
jgi:hypothetical protein